MLDATSLLRVTADDPDYRAAAAEAAFWQRPHPFGMESRDGKPTPLGPLERHTNIRFTGDPRVRWEDTICRHRTFRRGLALGTSSIESEARILATNPSLHLTFVDISGGPLRRGQDVLGARFPGRVSTLVADLNFAEFDAAQYDLVVSSASIHHVTNLEFCAAQIDRALSGDGYFFL